jgi:hypothetical protein
VAGLDAADVRAECALGGMRWTGVGVLSQSAAHPAVGRRDRNMTDRLQLRVPPPPALPHLCAIHPLPHSPRDAQLRKKGRHGCDGRGGFGKCTCRPYTRVSRPWCHVHASLRHPRVGRHQQLPKVGLTPAQPARAPFTTRAKHVHGPLTRTQASAEPPPAGNRWDAHCDLQGRHRGREGEQSPRDEHVNVSVSAQGREATVVKSTGKLARRRRTRRGRRGATWTWGVVAEDVNASGVSHFARSHTGGAVEARRACNVRQGAWKRRRCAPSGRR